MNIKNLLFGVFLITLLMPSCMGAEGNNLPLDCETILMQFIPTKVDTSGCVLRAVVQTTTRGIVPTKEMRIQQLTRQYWASGKYQKESTLEEFINGALAAIERHGGETMSAPLRRWRTEVVVSATNAYARYYEDDADTNKLTREVVRIKQGDRKWLDYEFDHLQGRITESIKHDANEYYAYFMVLAPQEGHREAWVKWYPALLRSVKINDTMAHLLCQSGQVTIGKNTYKVQFEGSNRCAFATITSSPSGDRLQRHVFERDRFVRLLRSEVKGPDIQVIVTYAYANEAAPWPSERITLEKSVLSDQITKEETVEIKEVVQESRWRIDVLLDSLLKNYAGYSRLKE